MKKILIATTLTVGLLLNYNSVSAKTMYKYDIHVKVLKKGINKNGIPYIITTDKKKGYNWYLELIGKENKSYNCKYNIGDSVHIKYNNDEEFIFGKDRK